MKRQVTDRKKIFAYLNELYGWIINVNFLVLLCTIIMEDVTFGGN